MKKLIYSYLFLFIPLIISAQTYPHQIEPDTTHRMIMMTDTSVIDSPAMEFLYFSIDSIVEQIARDTLGLDSTYWSLDDSLSLSPVNQTNNIILGSLSGNTSLTGSYNFIAGGSLGNSLTTGSYNSIFGGSNLSALTTGNYNTFFGFGHSELVTNSSESFISGFDNVSLATSLLRSFVNGRTNAISTTSLRDAFINGQDNGSGIATSLWYSFFNGLDNLENASNGSYVFANGFSNLKNVTNPNYSFANGLSNLGSGSSVSAQYSFFNGRDNALNSAGSVNYSFLNGHDNLRSGIGIDYGFLSGYRNLYQTTSDIQNTIAIGRENGYNAVDHSNSIYLGYRQGYTTGGTNKLKIGMMQDSPLIDGDFSTSDVTINDDLYVNSLETSDYLYSTSDQILGGNWVDGDWTLTGNIDTLFFGDPSNIDTVIVSAGDPDQTLSFSDPDLTISGSGGNTIDISGVNYWDTNADGIYTLDNVGINTLPHATHPLYVTGTMWLDGPVRDGNGSFSGGAGDIMTANSSGEFLWEDPSNISLSEFNNDLGLTQYWSLVGSDLFSNTGGSARDIIVGEIDMELPISGTPDQLMGRISSTGILNDINIGSGLSLSSGTLSATASSPWTDSGSYVQTTGSENVYIPGGEALLVGTTTESIYAVDIASTVEMRLLGDLYDKNSSNGAADDILTSDGDQIEWVTPEIDLTPPIGEFTYSSNTIINSTSNTNLNWNGTTLNDSGFTRNTTSISVPQTGNYLVTVSGTMTINSSCSATQRITVYLTGTGAYARVNGNGSTAKEVPFSITGIVTTGSTISAYGNLSATGGGCAGNIEDYVMAVTYLKS